MTARQFYGGDVGITHVVKADAVAALARKRFVVPLGERQDNLGMTFITGFLSREDWCFGRHFFQRIAAEKPKSRKEVGEEFSRDKIETTTDGQEHQPENRGGI
jgi:hypothetical protein